MVSMTLKQTINDFPCVSTNLFKHQRRLERTRTKLEKKKKEQSET